MRKIIFILLLLSGCATLDSYPYRACLYGTSRMVFDAGTVVARRDDGTRLFKYDDASRGDHGFAWIADEDRRLRPCTASSLSRYEE